MNKPFGRLFELESGPYFRWNVVPHLTTDALYSFATQTIELSNIDSAVYRKALDGDDFATRKVTILLAHEVRHWIDHVGSVWGQNLLCKGYNAIHARIANDPDGLWRVISFQRALRDTRFNSYYTTTEATSPPNGVSRWKFQLSAGARFDHRGRLSEDHPIVFTKFAWLDDTPACRVPLQQKLLELAYDPHWAEYSVAAHAIANFVRANNVPEAYELASVLASLALNLAPQHFTNLRVPESFRPWGGRNDAFITNADRGYAFLVLAKHAEKVPVKDIDEWAERTLRAAGLPPIAAVKRDATAEMEKLATDSVSGPLAAFRDEQLATGRKLFEDLGPIFRFKSVFERLKQFDILLPPIILGQDGTIVANGTISEWDQSAVGPHIDRVSKVLGECTEFAEACGF